jgi:hypothetical protein
MQIPSLFKLIELEPDRLIHINLMRVTMVPKVLSQPHISDSSSMLLDIWVVPHQKVLGLNPLGLDTLVVGLVGMSSMNLGKYHLGFPTMFSLKMCLGAYYYYYHSLKIQEIIENLHIVYKIYCGNS